MRRLVAGGCSSTCALRGVVERVVAGGGVEMSTLLGPEGAGVSLGSSGHRGALLRACFSSEMGVGGGVGGCGPVEGSCVRVVWVPGSSVA